jgi:hypothetical protein
VSDCVRIFLRGVFQGVRTLSRVIGILIMLTAALSAVGATIPPSVATYGVHLQKAWIPVKEGVRLAVTLYMPAAHKSGERFPALLETCPIPQDHQ